METVDALHELFSASARNDAVSSMVPSRGGKSWRQAAVAAGLQYASVNHSLLEFCRAVPLPAKPDEYVTAGTQCIDRSWQDMKKHIPSEIAAKDPKSKLINGLGSTLGSGDETVEGTCGLQCQPCFTAEDITDGGIVKTSCFCSTVRETVLSACSGPSTQEASTGKHQVFGPFLANPHGK